MGTRYTESAGILPGDNSGIMLDNFMVEGSGVITLNPKDVQFWDPIRSINPHMKP